MNSHASGTKPKRRRAIVSPLPGGGGWWDPPGHAGRVRTSHVREALPERKRYFPAVRETRRFSEAIAEGDGISVIVEVADADGARTAEAQRAEAITVSDLPDGVREATSLPIFWRMNRSAAPAGEK